MNRTLSFTKPVSILAGLIFMILTATASAQPTLTSITINPATLPGGFSSTGTVTLTSAPTSTMSIGLSSSSTNVVIPTKVNVPANATSATFPIQTKVVTQTSTFGITASDNKVTKGAVITLTVNGITGLALQPNFVTGGFATKATVTLAYPAPTGGWSFAIASNNLNAQVLPTGRVQAGATSFSFPVNTSFSPTSVATITVKDQATIKAQAQLDINSLIFRTFDGPLGSPTTINGISNKDAIVGFTTQNGVNSNLIFNPNFSFTGVNVGDPAGSLNAINSLGVGVGVANGTAFSANFATNGVPVPITIPNATSSVAFGINDKGWIVGQYTLTSGVTPGFLDINGTITTLMPKPNAMVVNAQSVSNSNIVCGFYSINGTNQFPFTYNIATKTYGFPLNPSTSRINTMGLVLTQFLSINDHGDVAGYYQTNNGSQFGLVYSTTTGKYTFYDPPEAAPVGGVQITQLVGISNDEIAGFYIDGAGLMHGLIAK